VQRVAVTADLGEQGDVDPQAVEAVVDRQPVLIGGDEVPLTDSSELLQMRRPLTDLPPVPIPAGVRITTYADPDDDAELLRVTVGRLPGPPNRAAGRPPTLLSAAASRGSTRAGCSSRSTNTDKLFGFHWTKV